MTSEGLDAALREAKAPQSDLVARKLLAGLRAELFGAAEESVRVGRFLVLGRLGAGASGVVYAAYDPQLERKIALKVLRSEAASSRERILAEARSLARLHHPNVLTVHDVGEFEGGVYLATELVDGADLRAWLAAEARSWRALLPVFIEAGRGLSAAHEVGLVHRDFKPANVLVGAEGRVRIADFGLALRGPSPDDLPNTGEEAGDESPGDARAATVAGTPAYMAPEQLRGELIDARADQLGFCLALHEALFGPLPALELELAAIEARLAKLRERARSGATRPGIGRIPARLRRALVRGLASDPADRFPSMAELLAELERVPRARRRVLRGGAALTLLIAVALGARLSAEPAATTPNPCAEADAELRELWTPDRREALRETLLSSDSPYARDTWAKLSRGLDDYAARWSTARREVCEATHLRHEQSGELLDARVACLSRRAELFAATLDQLADSPGALDKAVDAVARLPELEFCANDRVLLSLVRPPEDRETRAAAEALRRRLADARALLHLGRYADARVLAEQLSAEAEPLEHPPLRAEIELVLGQIDWYGGSPKEAEPILRRALWAAESSRHEEVARAAATALVGVVGADLKQREDAGRWIEHARAINRRLGIADGWTAELARLTASALASALELDEAMRVASLGLERAGSPREQIFALSVVATIHRKRGELEAAIARYREVVAAVRSLYGSAHPSVAKAANNLGNALADAGRRSEAIEAYGEAVELWTKAVADDDWVSAQFLANLGTALSEDGRHAEAIAHQRRAVAILAAEPPDLDLALRHANLANSLVHTGALDEAREHYQRAIEIFEARGAGDSIELSYPLLGLGESYMQERRFAAAVPLFERAYALTRESEDPELAREAAFAYGRSLVESGEDRRRGLALVRGVLDEVPGPDALASGPTRAELEQWLAELAAR